MEPRGKLLRSGVVLLLLLVTLKAEGEEGGWWGELGVRGKDVVIKETTSSLKGLLLRGDVKNLWYSALSSMGGRLDLMGCPDTDMDLT